MNTYKIARTGLPPIQFSGAIIGSDTTRDHNSTRWVNVDIYHTNGGNYVASVVYRTIWQGESDRHTAGSFKTAGEVIEWLKGDDGHTLGRASQGAVEGAAKVDSNFAEAWTEKVE